MAASPTPHKQKRPTDVLSHIHRPLRALTFPVLPGALPRISGSTALLLPHAHRPQHIRSSTRSPGTRSRASAPQHLLLKFLDWLPLLGTPCFVAPLTWICGGAEYDLYPLQSARLFFRYPPSGWRSLPELAPPTAPRRPLRPAEQAARRAAVNLHNAGPSTVARWFTES